VKLCDNECKNVNIWLVGNNHKKFQFFKRHAKSEGTEVASAVDRRLLFYKIVTWSFFDMAEQTHNDVRRIFQQNFSPNFQSFVDEFCIAHTTSSYLGSEFRLNKTSG
jgi:hypothetical protein